MRSRKEVGMKPKMSLPFTVLVVIFVVLNANLLNLIVNEELLTVHTNILVFLAAVWARIFDSWL